MTSRTPISVWSAGCSTGEEPYTIAVELLRVATPYGAGVLATDLSASSLEKASRGRYGSSALRFGAEDALKGFARRIGPREVEVIPRVRDLVKFRQHNLLTPATDLGSFDFVFCRNVLIYFDEQTRVQILERIRDVLRPGGLLFTGLTECLLELPDGLVQELHGGAFAFRRKG